MLIVSANIPFYHNIFKSLLPQIRQNAIIVLPFKESFVKKHHCAVVVERRPRVREVAGSIPVRVIPKTITRKCSTLFGGQGCGVRIATDWLVSGKMNQ